MKVNNIGYPHPDFPMYFSKISDMPTHFSWNPDPALHGYTCQYNKPEQTDYLEDECIDAS